METKNQKQSQLYGQRLRYKLLQFRGGVNERVVIILLKEILNL
jgi:hypothetical protein